MRNLFSILVFVMFTTLAHAGDEVIVTDPDDPGMIAAVEMARDKLTEFLADYATYKGRATDYGVKVAFPVKRGGNEFEVIWVTFFDQIDDTHFVGRLSNEPNFMPGLHLDSDVRFTLDMIQDWYILEGGKVYGYFTVRVLLPEMNEKTADEVRRSMHDNPLPPRFQ